MRRALIVLLAGALLASDPASGRLAGVVYVDANANGRRDPGEPARAGVRVSNGRAVQVTGVDGRYRFAEAPGGFVWITRPDDFACPRWYRRDGGDFGLVPEPFPDDFFFVQISDVHAYAEPGDFARYTLADRPWWLPEGLGAFALSWVMAHGYERPRREILADFRRALDPHRDTSELSGSRILVAYLEEFERPGSELGRVVPQIRAALAEVAALRPAFVINTGDLVMEGNAAPPDVVESWFELYDDLSESTGLSIYDTIGNNEIAGSALDDFPPGDPLYGKGAFRRFRGPTAYSFDRGPFHFVAIDSHRRIERPGRRPDWEFVELSPETIEWLDADLGANAERVLVALNHEPFHRLPGWTLYDPVDDAGLFARHGVAYSLAGHIHRNGIERREGTLHVTTGALSGMRWALPPSVHPRGYRLFQAADRRLYSAWKEIGRPLLGFVHPAGEDALFAAGELPTRADALREVVVVAADAQGPFASLELEAGGRPVALRRWSDYFAHAVVAADVGELRLRARSRDGAEREARLVLSPTRTDP